MDTPTKCESCHKRQAIEELECCECGKVMALCEDCTPIEGDVMYCGCKG